MSIPDYSDLTQAQRREYIRTQIRHTDWFNRTGAAILRDLEARGLGIPRSTFYSIRRDKLAPTPLENILERLGPNDTIPVSYAEPRPDWDLSRKYQYQLKVVGRDPTDGSRKVGFFALSSDDLLSKSQVGEFLQAMMEGKDEFYEIQAEEISAYRFYKKEA